MSDKGLEYWKKNAEEDYRSTPISVLRYITELEEKLTEREVAPCDVEGCENETASGGMGWSQYGYWCLCHEHLKDSEKGFPVPDMKQKALEREANRK